MATATPAPLSSLDIALGRLFGFEADPDGPPTDPLGTPRQELERAVVDAVSRDPCFVSFSGGRDSAAILAVAVHVARREGLPDPVPLTRVFPTSMVATQEGEWQELIVRHLNIVEWNRDHLTNEMDLLGPHAQRLLCELGVVWPGTLSANLLTTRWAQGGAVLDGEGGDDLMVPRLHRIGAVSRAMRARPLPTRGQLRGAALSLLPAPPRGRWTARHVEAGPMPWLRPDVREEFRRRRVRQIDARPLNIAESIRQVPRARTIAEWKRNRDALAAREGVDWRSPFLGRRFVEAFARATRPLGYRSRGDALSSIVGDLLPDEVCYRVGKASFGEAFVSDYSEEFLEQWTGEGLDERLVDPRAVAQWARENRDSRLSLLMQAGWLATRGSASCRDSRPKVDR